MQSSAEPDRRNFQPIGLGDRVKDPITGYTGIVVSQTTWLNGCVRCCVQSETLHEGRPVDEQHFDQGRLALIEAGVHPALVVEAVPAPEPIAHRSVGGPSRESRGFSR